MRGEDLIDWLYGLQHFGIKLGLDNIRALLEMLDRPQRAFRTVHVGGTNGKGSVAAMVESMARAAGLRTGLFTSPHLVRPHERIRVDGVPIPDPDFQALLDDLRGRIEDGMARGALEAHPSFFEVVTAAALCRFRDAGVDVAVLEVGLGGRLDATNAVDADVAAIVSIGLDHTKSLGPTIRKIAFEKAGIVKAGRPLVCGAVQQAAIDEIRGACRARRARYVDARAAVRFVAEDAATDPPTVTFASSRAPEGRHAELRIGLPGRHQIDNARVAIAAFEELAAALGRPAAGGALERAVREGLAAVRWPGRLEWRDADTERGRPRMLFDAAHNPEGIRTLARYLDERTARGERPPVLLFGTTNGKPLDPMLLPLVERSARAVLTAPAVRRGIHPAELIGAARRSTRSVELVPDVRRALELALRRTPPGGWLLVTGSLYLVGQVQGLLEGRPVPGPVAM